jgi:general secretion pathway protein A
MYNHYFGFAEPPFSIAPDPRYLYLSEQHREALAHLLYGIEHGGFVVLTGEVGTGKTTVCRCLLQQIPDHIDVAVVVNPKLNAHELLQTICEELGVAVDEEASDKQLIDALNEFLLATYARGRNAILIVDEAQNLAIDTLEQLRLLTNLETNERKLLQLVLLGQPELNELLAQPALRQLSQRITARFHLRPLRGDEIERYIGHRLAIAGRAAGLFQPAAIRLIGRLSQGIPRLVNLLCDRALLGTYASNGASVDTRMVRRAAGEVLPPTLQRWRWRLPTLLGLAGVLLGVLLWLALPMLTAPAVATASHAKPAWLNAAAATDGGAALSELYTLWQRPEAAHCPAELADGLSCVVLEGLAGADLRRYNRPAVLDLTGGGALLLTRLEGEAASIRTGAQEWQLPWAELAPRWSGRAQLLAGVPTAALPLEEGDEGEVAAWLDERLQRLYGDAAQGWQRWQVVGSDALAEQGADKPAWLASQFLALYPKPLATRYDTELLQRVQRFQREHGLSGDGTVGLETLLTLSRLVDDGLPRLADDTVQRGG